MAFAAVLIEEAGEVVKHLRGSLVEQVQAVAVVVGTADLLCRNTLGEGVHQSNAEHV